MALNAKTDLKCSLIETETGKELLKMKVTATSDLLFTAGFEGGGVASGGQSFEVMTEQQFDYMPYTHSLLLLDRKFIITTARIAVRKRLGSAAKRIKKVYILGLE